MRLRLFTPSPTDLIVQLGLSPVTRVTCVLKSAVAPFFDFKVAPISCSPAAATLIWVLLDPFYDCRFEREEVAGADRFEVGLQGDPVKLLRARGDPSGDDRAIGHQFEADARMG